MYVLGDNVMELLTKIDEVVAIDTETTGLEANSDLLGISLAWYNDGLGIKSCYISYPNGEQQLDFGHLGLQDELSHDGLSILLEHIATRYKVVMHNQVFDHRMLALNLGTPPADSCHDTMHMARCADAQEFVSLDFLVNKYVEETPGWYRAAKKQRKNLKGLPIEEQARYARQDAEYTLRLYFALREVLVGRKLFPPACYLLDREFARVVMRMVSTGVPVCQEWINDKRRQILDRLAEIEQAICRLTGDAPELGSNSYVAHLVFTILGCPKHGVPITKQKSAKWPDGIPSVSKEVLEPLAYSMAEHSSEVALVLEHRELQHALDAWLDEYLVLAERDGRIHSLLNPFGTVSHRMSSQRPNLQGVPMEDRGNYTGGLKGAFCGLVPGETLWAADYKQAEVRMAALLSGDRELCAVLCSGGDPYTTMAERIWGDPDRRQDAKRAMLASIYEIGPNTFAATHKVSVESAYEVLDTFRAMFPTLRQASQQLSRFCEQKHYVRSYTGKPRFFLPDEPFYKAFNQRVQMSVACLVEQAMVQIEQEFPGRMVLQVHDSIVLSVPDGDEGQAVLARVAQIMQDAFHIEPDQCLVPESERPPFLVDVKPWQ